MKILENHISFIESLSTDAKNKTITTAIKPVYSFICENIDDQKSVMAFVAIQLNIREIKK